MSANLTLTAVDDIDGEIFGDQARTGTASAGFVKGFNFRATSGYVTDAASDTYVISTDAYPTTRNGVTFGLVDNSNFDWQFRDRNSGNDSRIAGMAFQDASPLAADKRAFRVDLPATGNYSIEIAAGDPDGTQHIAYLIKDDTTTVLTQTDTTTSAGQRFLDSTGTELTNVTWPGSHSSSTLAFSSTTNGSGGPIFRLELTDLGATARVISHVRITQL